MGQFNFAEWVPEDVREQMRNTFARWEADGGMKDGPSPDRKAEYAQYRRGKGWKQSRKRILKRDRGICIRCEGRAWVVHHRSYAGDVMAGNNDSQLASLCEGCHTVIHFDELGKRRTREAVELLLLTKCHDTEIPAP